MKSLLALAVLLTAACGVFALTGLPAIERMRRAHAALLQREGDLQRSVEQQAPVASDNLQALAAEHEALARSVGARLAALTGGAGSAPQTRLEVELARSHLGALGPDDKLTIAVKAQAASSPQADAALAAILRALSGADRVDVDALTLRNDGRLQSVPNVPQLQQMEAQIVLTAGTPEALNCLEALAPERARGLPVISVESSSLRRIEPERWGSSLQRYSGPPVRLSISLAILFATPGGS